MVRRNKFFNESVLCIRSWHITLNCTWHGISPIAGNILDIRNLYGLAVTKNNKIWQKLAFLLVPLVFQVEEINRKMNSSCFHGTSERTSEAKGFIESFFFLLRYLPVWVISDKRLVYSFPLSMECFADPP